MFDRISASFSLAKSSWQVLLENKKLIVFPLISGFFCLLVLASFVAPLFFLEEYRQIFDRNDPRLWVLGFLFYFINYFIVVFFNSALISCALIRFNGGEPTLADGFNAAVSRLPQIFAWALVSATIGMLLKAVENSNEKAGQFLSAILGTIWSVLTFFVVPVLVVEKLGPIDAVKRSVGILKQTWGEAAIGNLGLGLFTFLLGIPGFLLIPAAVYVGANVAPVLGVVLGVGAVIYLVLWSAASSALSGIFLGALYQYAARGQMPANFEEEHIRHAFMVKA